MNAAPTPDETIHASSVASGGRAVLIRGPSGSGKSDLALRLIDRGWVLVSDDYTIVRPIGGRLVAQAPPNIAGKIEIRGVGIVAMDRVSQAPVALVVDLDRPVERMPEPDSVRIAGIAVARIAANALEASAPLKVEAAFRLVGSSTP